MSSPYSSGDELQRAIALSLQDPNLSPSAEQHSQTSSPDNDLEGGIALSLGRMNSLSPSDKYGMASDIIVISDTEDDTHLRMLGARKSQAQCNESVKFESLGSDHRDPTPRADCHDDDGLRRTHTSQVQADEVPIGSTESSHQIPSLEKSSKQYNSQLTVSALKSTIGSNGILSNGIFDRKKMEDERLARARKRKASPISPPPLNRKPFAWDQKEHGSESSEVGPVKVPAMHVEFSNLDGEFPFSVPEKLLSSRPLSLAECIPVRGAPLLSSKTPETSKATVPTVISYKQHMDLMKPGIHFPDGVVKRTWAQGYPRENDIKIEEVLQKNDLEFAVLSAFQWDTDWVISKLDLAKTKLMCIVQATSEQEKSRMRSNVPPSIRFCFPSMAGNISCMHSKLQLLAHPTHLRIVIPSANLVPFDWGEEGGVMENIIFIIDLPRLEHGPTVDGNSTTPFQRELTYFLKAMEMDCRILDSLMKFDFSRTAHLAFVHSIGGSHTGNDWKRTGYSGLGSAIQELGLARKEPLNVDFVSASIGSLTVDFIKSMYLAAQGDDGTTELDWRVNRPPKSRTQSGWANQTNSEKMTSKSVEEHFRIYFPSRDTVVRSKGGIGAGGTICFQSRWYDSDRFPRSLMRDCKSQRPGMLMHSKMIFARPSKPLLGANNQLYAAWAYVGSANLSEAAWGRLSKEKSTKTPKMNCRNWECGVIVPVPAMRGRQSENEGRSSDEEDWGKRKEIVVPSPTFEVFEGVVPVPMVVPGEPFGDRRPWFYNP